MSHTVQTSHPQGAFPGHCGLMTKLPPTPRAKTPAVRRPPSVWVRPAPLPLFLPCSPLFEAGLLSFIVSCISHTDHRPRVKAWLGHSPLPWRVTLLSLDPRESTALVLCARTSLPGPGGRPRPCPLSGQPPSSPRASRRPQRASLLRPVAGLRWSADPTSTAPLEAGPRPSGGRSVAATPQPPRGSWAHRPLRPVVCRGRVWTGLRRSARTFCTMHGVKCNHVGIVNIIRSFLFSSSTSEICKIKLIY